MRSIVLVAVSAISTAASAGSALAAGQPELDVHTLAAGAAANVGVRDDQTVPTNNPNATLNSSVQDVAGASFAHASATATFGALHAYSDAFLADPNQGDAQSSSEATYIDYFDGSAWVTGKTYNLSFNITGSTSAQPQFGPGPSAQVTWRLDDLTSLDTILLGAWDQSKPFTNFVVPFLIPAGHVARLYIDLDLFTYDGTQSVPGLVFADYKDTIINHIDAADGSGPAIVGLSGHDYATSAAIPEPATWGLMIGGFGLAGAALRRRRAVAA